MAYNFPKIGSTLFAAPVRITIDLLSTQHHSDAEGIPAAGLGRCCVAEDPWRGLGSRLSMGKSLLYVPQLRQW
jgi:hypothetical protein